MITTSKFVFDELKKLATGPTAARRQISNKRFFRILEKSYALCAFIYALSSALIFV